MSHYAWFLPHGCIFGLVSCIHYSTYCLWSKYTCWRLQQGIAAVSTSYFYLCLQAFQFKQMHIWYALDRVLCAWNDLMPYPYLMMQGILYLDAIVYIGLLFWSGDFGWKIYHTDILLCSYWLSSVNFLCYLWWWFCAYIWTAWSRYKCCGSRWANSASLECCAWSYSSCWATFERRS